MTRLYVGNLSWNTTQDTLKATFGANGRNCVLIVVTFHLNHGMDQQRIHIVGPGGVFHQG